MTVKRLLGSVTIGGLVAALVGAGVTYVVGHVDPAVGAIIGAIGGLLGVGTHAANAERF